MAYGLVWGLVLAANAAVGQPALAKATADKATADQCRETLQQALQDKNPDTRKQAVMAVSLAGAQFFLPVKGMLQDEDVQVRLAAVETLAEVKGPQALAALRAALDDTAPEVGFAAARALWALHDTAGREALLAVLEGDTKSASGPLTKQKRDAQRMVHTPRTLLLFAMRQGIGFAPVPYLGLGVASMQQFLSDPGVSGRATVALMLAHDKDPATLDALRAALTDKDWSVRAAAVQALALRRDPRMSTDVVPLLDDENQAVRLRAAAGYLGVMSGAAGGRINAGAR